MAPSCTSAASSTGVCDGAVLLTDSLVEDGDDAELHANRRDVVFMVLEMAPRCSPAALSKMEMTSVCTPAVTLPSPRG